MKSLIIGAVTGLILIMGMIVYYIRHADDDLAPEPQLIEQLARVRLGMSPTKVTKAVGKPSVAGKTEVDSSGHAHLTYVYTKNNNADYSLDITFHGANPASLGVAVICEKGGFLGLIGFDKNSTEKNILGELGTPSYTSIRRDELEKIISYAKWNASFQIAHGKVVGLCIHLGGFIQYDNEATAESFAINGMLKNQRRDESQRFPISALPK